MMGKDETDPVEDEVKDMEKVEEIDANKDN